MVEMLDSGGNMWLSCEGQVFKQGAEARLYRCHYLGHPAILKERFVKKYRHPILDGRLSSERMKAELTAMNKCKMAGINVPAVYFVNSINNSFIMEAVIGSFSVQQYIEECRGLHNFVALVSELGTRLGRMIAKLHLIGIVHGDLTTANILLSDHNPEVLVLIDFGLSEGDATVESKGVDLYVLKRAISSAHVNTDFLFSSILDGYGTHNPKQFDKVQSKLKEIEMRGRKREMMG